jgi:hypothetical protein
MTLVASFHVREWPVLVGDIMISIPASALPMRPFNIPTHGNVNVRAVPETGRMVSALVQKVNLLTPQLTFAWSGRSICAQSVFREILEQEEPATFGNLVRVLDGRRGEAGMELYLTGLHLSEIEGGRSKVVRFAWDSGGGWESRKDSIPGYGDCYIGGTGADALQSVLHDAVGRLPAKTPSLESAICMTLARLGLLAGDQMRTGAGIERLFGGAFEIATLLAGELRKVGDVTYHFWQVRNGLNGQAMIAFHAALRIDYFEDYLVIRKLEFGGGESLSVKTDELYVIRPVHRSVDEAERQRLIATIPRPSMNARFSVLYFHIPDREISPDTRVFVHKSGTAATSRRRLQCAGPRRPGLQRYLQALGRSGPPRGGYRSWCPRAEP